MSKIRSSARGESCTFRIPGVCNGDPDTVVLAHAPHPDKGMGRKGPDSWSAYACSACHDVMDGRRFSMLDALLATERAIAKERYWYKAICETQRRLLRKNVLVEK